MKQHRKRLLRIVVIWRIASRSSDSSRGEINGELLISSSGPRNVRIPYY
jgi:hypothetical protein